MRSSFHATFVTRAALWTALLVMLATSAQGQTAGSIAGLVTDPTGASVAGAKLTLRNQETTGLTGTTTSDGAGNFAFEAVPSGVYFISVQAAGFSSLEQKNIALTAGEKRSVGTLTLAVGSATQSVTVLAEATPVQVASAERSSDLDSQAVGTLLARGLSEWGLTRSLPGVAGAIDPDKPGQASGWTAINGTRFTNTIPTLDGINVSDPSSQGYMYSMPATDAITEVKFVTSNYQAEYGQSAGAIINLTTKSGTRQIHADAYFYLRNEDLNANSFFNNRNGVVRPTYRYIIGGFSIGGPVWIPKKVNTSKDKVFFFFNDERVHPDVPAALTQVTVPTALERAGNFSQSTTLAGVLIPIKQPSTGTPFPGNIVPPSLIDPNGQKLLSFFPLPNFLNRAISGGNYNYLFQSTPQSPANNYTMKADFNLTNKLRLYGRNNQLNNYPLQYGGVYGPAWGPELARGYKRVESPSVNATYTISPTLVNEATFGIQHWDEGGNPADQTEWNKISRSAFGITIGQWYPGSNPYGVVPFQTYSDITSGASWTTDARFPYRGATTIFTFTDNLTKVVGAHTFKMGVSAERYRMWKGNPGNAYSGNFSFGKDVNNPLDSNYGYSNALFGVFDTYTETSFRAGADYRSSAVEWYGQDSWKVTRRLTLEIGMRFTSAIPWYQRKNLMAGFDPSLFNPAQQVTLYVPGLNSAGQRVAVNPITKQQLAAVYVGAIVSGTGNVIDGMAVAGTPGVPHGMSNVPLVTPAPRFGFAYDPFGNGKTAVRGGFGIQVLPVGNGGTVATGNGYQLNPPIEYQPTVYYGTLSNLLGSAGTLFPGNVTGVQSYHKMPTNYSFSVGVQRSLGFSTVLDVAYVGNLGRHLEMSQNLNTLPYGKRFLSTSQDSTTGKPLSDSFLRPYVGYGTITYREYNGTSNYNALQVQANRRFSHGLEFKANWSWSKGMDYGSTDGATLPLYVNTRVWSYGMSSYDQTHIVNLAWLYDLPGSRSTYAMVRTVLGNWHLSGTTVFASGTPTGLTFTTTTGTDLTGGGDGQRVNITGNPSFGFGQRSFSEWFNTSVVQVPSLGSIGTAARDVFRGPGINNWDLSIFKMFPIREKVKLQIRGEFYNAFNHPQWAAVNTAAQFNASGAQINSQFGHVTSDRGGRVIQFALRVGF